MAERQEVEKKQRAEHEAQELAYVSKLQQYQATIAALDQCNPTVVEENPPIQHTKVSTGVLRHRPVFMFDAWNNPCCS